MNKTPNLIAEGSSNRSPKFLWIYVLIIILLMPALWINLGLMPLIEDESIRALVAQEMLLTDNYVVPSLGGEYYYNKPPVYNWLIATSFILSQDYSEWAVRYPMLLSLLAYALSIFFIVRRYYGEHVAFLNALMLITCGRIFFYDSMLGLIDITYSWLTYLSFMLIYHYHQKERWAALFLLSYAIAALTFLMKGLTSIAFQAITLLALFVWQRDVKRLFSKWHFLGIGLFLLIVGAYYYSYHQYNSLETAFVKLFTESSDKTLGAKGLIDTITHISTFPLQLFYHFAPFTLMVVFFIPKRKAKNLEDKTFRPMKVIKADPLLHYVFIIFWTNVLIFWLSPIFYARYVLMLMPLMFMLLLELYRRYRQQLLLQTRLLEYCWLIMLVVLLVGAVAVIYHPKTQSIGYLWIKAGLPALALSVLLVFFFRYRHHRLLLLMVALIIFRIAFNFTILPARFQESRDVSCREDAYKLAEKTKNQKLYIYGMPGKSYKYINYQSMYYITAKRQKLLLTDKSHDPEAFYIAYDYQLKGKDYTTHFSLGIRHNRQVVKVVKFKEAE